MHTHEDGHAADGAHPDGHISAHTDGHIDDVDEHADEAHGHDTAGGGADVTTRADVAEDTTEPTDDTGPAVVLAIGDPCTTSSECPAGGSGTAACMTDWPGGYCAVTHCDGHAHDCPGDAGDGSVGAKCVSAPGLVCLIACVDSTGCRDGYECAFVADGAGHGQAKVCMPK